MPEPATLLQFPDRHLLTLDAAAQELGVHPGQLRMLALLRTGPKGLGPASRRNYRKLEIDAFREELLQTVGLTAHSLRQATIEATTPHPLMTLLVSRFIRGRIIVLGLVSMLTFGMLGSLVLF